ncbi:hypothetical protein GZ77_20095 [Endozoicomonas montiporae]|uniref:STAS domain-containing protein n=2 Tax=Endozoicomonas montiporae TaxID=1027273 RepID=A0A081N2U4_9GAMM|nr:STAS domain-containing protein [Endozoicomonas montiporae]AMO58036.1 phospholipid transport system transporter-binding protein [Endozoicomonas montiporae CL-33]KEQ12767.1 hypothetical protein GZ77_20095 [Endozoicomonas montiporae]
MSLERLEPGHYTLRGIVTFDNAAVVEQTGRELLLNELTAGQPQIRISLKELHQGDSATLSVCLSWLRLSGNFDTIFCFSDIPVELQALAKVCGIDNLLEASSCPVS